MLDYADVINSYINVTDWRVKKFYCYLFSRRFNIRKLRSNYANYWLSEVYDKEIADAHRNCDIHLHDLSMLTGYCAGWSLKQLIQDGLGGVQEK